MKDPALTPPEPFNQANTKLFLSTKNLDLESALIRWNGLDDYSHCGWINLDCLWTYSAMNDGRGVAHRPPIQGTKILVMDAPGTWEAYQLALKREGDGYDSWDILGMVFGKNWHHEGDWICSYLVAYHYKAAGFPLFNDYYPLIHIKPGHMLLPLAVKVLKEVTINARNPLQVQGS